MNLNAQELEVLASDGQAIGVFFRLDTDPVVRLWLGVGAIDVGVNAIDPLGVAYDGFGELLNAPAVQQLINGTAERVDFHLSGVSPRILAMAVDEAMDVQQCAVHLGIGIMDREWQLLGPVHMFWRGTADILSVNVSASTGPSSPGTRSVTLSVGSQGTGRRRGRLAYWTDQDQQRRSPGDRFCERVGQYAQVIRKVWPRF